VLSAAFEAADLAGRPSWEAESAEDEEAMESAEVESLEAAAFLEDLYSRELAFEQEATASVTYPSGATLQVVSGPTAKGEEHWDPLGTGQPLLDTSEPVRATRLSTDFTVAQLLGGKHFDKARIDPELVRALQKLRDYVGKPLHIASGYRPYAYNVELYTSKYHRTPTMSRHSTGQAADVEIQGMTGMAIAKAAIDTLGTRIGVGIDSNNAHIDVRGKWARWTYFKDKQQNDRAIAEIEAYRRQREHGGPPAQPTPAGAPSASPAPPAQGVAEALGRGLWDVAVRLAIDSGVTDVNQLTNLLFYFRHPEMRGKRIGADQRDLAREWTDIRDRLVTPALHGRQATRQPGAAPARPSRRELELMAEVLPLLERLRGDIPLDFLLGWVAVESGGNINAKGSAKLDERGYFQISREEASSMGLDHDRIRSDKEYSVWAGVQLARRYAKLVQTRFPTVPYGTELFWRIVKFMHAIGMGDAPALLKHMQQDGVEISSWDAVARYAASRGDDLHRRKILRHLPTRFIENVDHLYAAGRRFAAALAR
jgi:hypothetical protein